MYSYSKDIECFTCPQKLSHVPPLGTSPFLPQPLVTTVRNTVCIVFPFFRMPYKNYHTVCSFRICSICILSFKGLLKFIYIVYISSLFFFFKIFFQVHTQGIQKFLGQGSNWSYSCQPIPQPQKCQIQAESVTCTKDHGNTRCPTQ